MVPSPYAAGPCVSVIFIWESDAVLTGGYRSTKRVLGVRASRVAVYRFDFLSYVLLLPKGLLPVSPFYVNGRVNTNDLGHRGQ